MTAVPPRPAAPECTCGPGVWATCDQCGADAWCGHHCGFPCDDVTCENGTVCTGCLTGRLCPVHNDDEWEDATMTAPDATAGDGLRSVLIEQLRPAEPWPGAPSPERIVSTVLALPALRDVLAAAARDAEKVRRVEQLASEWVAYAPLTSILRDAGRLLRRALDPS